MSITKKRAFTILGGALAAGLICGAGAVAFAAQSDPVPVEEAGSSAWAEKLLEQVTAPSAPPKAGDEVSIGPWAVGKPAPDLTPVDLENGQTGYLRVFDLAKPTTELESRKIDEKTEEFIVPVYAEDGQKVIGEFVVGTATEGTATEE